MPVRFVVAAFFVAFAAPAFSQESYRVDPLHTASTFSISHLGVAATREFRQDDRHGDAGPRREKGLD